MCTTAMKSRAAVNALIVAHSGLIDMKTVVRKSVCYGYSVIHLTGHYNTQCCVGHIEKSDKGWWNVISYTDSSLNTNRPTFNEAREYAKRYL